MQIDRALVKNVLDIYIRVGMESMDAYEADFEAELLTSTAAYYKRKVGFQDDLFPDQRMHELCVEKQGGPQSTVPNHRRVVGSFTKCGACPFTWCRWCTGATQAVPLQMQSDLLLVHSGFVAVLSSYSCFLSLQL